MRFLRTEMAQAIVTLPHERQGPVYLTVNIIIADDLGMWEAIASAVMVLT